MEWTEGQAPRVTAVPLAPRATHAWPWAFPNDNRRLPESLVQAGHHSLLMPIANCFWNTQGSSIVRFRESRGSGPAESAFSEFTLPKPAPGAFPGRVFPGCCGTGEGGGATTAVVYNSLNTAV
jgi:hypothetical protein